MRASPGSLSLLFLGANTPWVYALAESFAACGQQVTAIATFDSRNFRRLRPSWPGREQPALLQREFWVFPPGYVGTLARVFGPFLRSRLARSRARLDMAVRSEASAWVIAPYPWFVHALRRVPDGRLIYYNLDDYVLYKPTRSATILRQESELVRRAALTLCLSQEQVETLRARFPKRAHCIQHFPLGVVDDLLNSDTARPPNGPVVGYIGNLIDRVDWRLVREVAGRLPDVEFHFIGGMEGYAGGGIRPNWECERAAALALPNVHNIGLVSQDEVGRYYWNFAINWMPYAIGHPFNKASCPTKIMDGLASGRPVLSTDLPECRLYPEWISIVRSAHEAATQIRKILDAAPSAAAREISRRQVKFVRERHTWTRRAELLESWLPQIA